MRTFALLTTSLIISALVAYYAVSESNRFLSDYRLYGFVYASWVGHLLAWVFFRLIAWPKLLAHLRHLPEPTVRPQDVMMPIKH